MSTAARAKPRETIQILAAPEAGTHGLGGLQIRPTDVPLDVLRENVASLHRKFSSVLTDLPQGGDFECSEFTLAASITVSGQVQVIGFAQAGGEIQGGVTFTFTRRSLGGARGPGAVG